MTTQQPEPTATYRVECHARGCAWSLLCSSSSLLEAAFEKHVEVTHPDLLDYRFEGARR